MQTLITGGKHTANQKSEEDAIVALLKACIRRKDLLEGERLHSQILNMGFLGKKNYVGNNLLKLYTKCGALPKAQKVFDQLRAPNIVSWNVLITGYAQHGHGKIALLCFEEMQHKGLLLDAVAFVCALKACGNIGAFEKGIQIHALVVKEGLLEKSLVVGTALVDMYAKCRVLSKAQEVFDDLQVQNVVCWTALITGYIDHGACDMALACYERMQHEGVLPDAIIFIRLLKVCGNIGAADKGREIHSEIVREGLLGKNVLVGTALMDMYVKWGALEEAQQIFDQLGARDAVSWNALITGFAQQGHGKEALSCFEKMQQDGLSPSAVTFVCILKACACIGAAKKGREIHADIVKKGLGSNLLVGTTLMDMYVKFGNPESAQEVFDELPKRDRVSWNALIACYAQHGPDEEAISCFDMMQCEGLSPDMVTYASVLKACGNVGASDKGKAIHAEICRAGLQEYDNVVGNVLVDMYAKFGDLEKAQKVFRTLAVRDVVTWTALISACAQAGKHELVFESFHKMIEEGIEPNLITFTVIINVCSHLGLLEKGKEYFDAMRKNHGIDPTLELFTCMVDLFGRAGHFDKAVATIKEMTISDYFPVWSALLAACQKWRNVKLGRWAFERAVQLAEKDASIYICMRNIYVVAAMHDDADKIEAMRVKNEAWDKEHDFMGIPHLIGQEGRGGVTQQKNCVLVG